MSRLEGLRNGIAPLVLYPILALLAFPTLGAILGGEHGLIYALDVVDLPRSGVGADWLDHGLTLWNTHLTAGDPLLAQQAISPFAPDVVLAFLVGPFAAATIVGWGVASFAGISMHLFLRDSIRLSTAAVIGGATLFLFSFWHPAYGFSTVALPLVLWLSDRACADGPRRWPYVLGGVLVGAFILYDGQAQVVILLAGIQLAYLVTTAPGGSLRRRIGLWATTWILALALYGPVLITQLVMLPISQRTAWDLRALFDPRLGQAIRDTLDHYSSVLFGVPVGAGLGGSVARYGTYFLGGIGLPMLVLGVVGAPRDRRGRFLLALLVAIPLLDLVAVLLTPLQDQLGFLKSFQVVRIRHFLPFALVANAAYGLDLLAVGILDGRPILPTGRLRRAVVGLAFVPLAIGLAVSAWQVAKRRHDLLQLDVQAVGWALSLAAMTIALVAVAGLAVALVRARPQLRRSAGVVLLGLILVIGAERALWTHAERFAGSDLGTWASGLAETPGQAFLLAQPGIDVDRVLTFGEDANRMGAVGLLQADGYEAIYPLTYHTFFGGLIGPQLDTDPAKSTYYRQWGNRAIAFGPLVDPELVALDGIRWLYVKGPEIPSVPGIVARFHDGDVTVYEVPDALPRAFIAGGLAVEPDPGAVAGAVAAASLEELRGVAHVVTGPGAEVLRAALPDGDRSRLGAAGSATISGYSPDRVEIDIHADRPGVLVLTDVMAPGWIAERDGMVVPIATVDGTFRGVPVDAATRRVTFRYEPGFTYAGFGLAIFTTLILGLLATLGIVRDRRRGRVAQNSASRDPDRGPQEPSSTTLRVDTGDGPAQSEER